jgi:hypothetical protein
VSISKHFYELGAGRTKMKQIATLTAFATHMGQRPIIFRSEKKINEFGNS